jgi:peptidoglycan-N-acetylglucosamine deacetylase
LADCVIFEDATGARRRWAVLSVCLLALGLIGLSAVVSLGLFIEPHFGTAVGSSSKATKPAAPPRVRASAFVFAAANDPPGARSISENIAQIDVIATDWFRIRGSTCAIEETIDDASRGWAARDDVRVLARIANLAGDAWSTAGAGAMLRSPETRACVARQVADRVRALGAKGVNVDFESLAPADANGLVAFLEALRSTLGPERLVTIDVTPGDAAYDLARIAPIVDAVVLMAYDEHEETSAPGPIASRDWFASVVDRTRASVPSDKLIVGVGSYCYDWGRETSGSPSTLRAEPLSYAAAMQRAADSGSHPRFRSDVGGTAFRYESGGRAHEVWCADAPAVENQLAALRERGLDRWALWRAGSEDPSLWAAVAASTDTDKRDALGRVAAPSEVRAYGSGRAWTMSSPPVDGERDVLLADDGTVRSAVYRTVPAARSFLRRGGGDRREVVLTFDDGPHDEFTPMILDALRALGAEGTFFVVGDQAMRHPDLVARIAREGHTVGNHTFHHPRLDALSADDLRRELLWTERVLEGLVGRYTPLFRAPYAAAFDAREPAQLALNLPAFEAGYTVVGADVDPADWSLPGAGAIADSLLAGVEAGGRVVVLHDGGGDRRQTAEALALALPRLRQAGYRIVPLDTYVGLTRAQLAPPVDGRDEALARGVRAASVISSRAPTALAVLFTTCTAVAAARVAMLIALALRRRKGRVSCRRSSAADPLVTVIVPSHNEEKVLRATVESLLASDYGNIEVVVVDDGSTDATFAVARSLTAADPRVRTLWQQNAGKAAAANLGIECARGDFVVTVDADTLIAPDAVRRLVQHFDDPDVWAVCGNIEVGNVRSTLTLFQAIEYVTSQNLDRRALAAVNSIGVVPGALGAWRRDAVLRVGGYSSDTLVEDADLTLSVLRAGGRIEYEPAAVGRTEAPETLRGLWKQRFRWTYGTYQCLAKHRRGLLDGSAGLLALPNMVLFQVIFPVLSPIGDAMLLAALLSRDLGAVASGYLGFLAMDLLASAVAFRLDRKPLRWLPMLLVQRFTYRQLLSLVCIRAFAAAIAGRRHGWRKLERTGTTSPASAAVGPARNRSREPIKRAA